MIAGLIAIRRSARGPRRRGRARSASTRCPKRRKNGESRRPRGAADRREGLPCSGNVPPARPSGTRFPLENMTSVARVHIVAIDPPAGRLTLDVKTLTVTTAVALQGPKRYTHTSLRPSYCCTLVHSFGRRSAGLRVVARLPSALTIEIGLRGSCWYNRCSVS